MKQLLQSNSPIKLLTIDYLCGMMNTAPMKAHNTFQDSSSQPTSNHPTSNHPASKSEIYPLLIKQLTALVQGENDQIANLGNTMALLKSTLNVSWVGVYEVRGDELVLGPFQGEVACTRIPYGKGVCGTSWKEKAVINVPDVTRFHGHIACSSTTKSELVLPIFTSSKEVKMVLDLDSDELSFFEPIDEHYLKQVVAIIEGFLNNKS